MGGMCARVCPTEVLCEQACVRNAHEDKPVDIGLLQRFATDPVFASGQQLFDRAEPSGKRVAVVVPAYDEERLIASTIASIPGFVDRIIVVDDGSGDGTASLAAGADPRVEVVAHERNLGVGAAIVTGYRRAAEEKLDVTCVMAADGQMDPVDLEQGAAVSPAVQATRSPR